MTDTFEAPVIHVDHATEENAVIALNQKPVSFLYRSVLFGCFYAALILGSIQGAASQCVDGMQKVFWLEALTNLVHEEVQSTDVFPCDASIPRALRSLLMQEPQADLKRLKLK